VSDCVRFEITPPDAKDLISLAVSDQAKFAIADVLEGTLPSPTRHLRSVTLLPKIDDGESDFLVKLGTSDERRVKLKAYEMPDPKKILVIFVKDNSTNSLIKLPSYLDGKSEEYRKDEMQKRLNVIFSSGIVKIEVTIAGEENIAYDANEDDKLTMYQNLAGTLNEVEYKKVREESTFKQTNPNFDAYVFIFGEVKVPTPNVGVFAKILGKNFDGDIMMNWGVFNDELPKDYLKFNNVVAHECGHALFKFKHPFDEFANLPVHQSCLNVMDYCETLPFPTFNRRRIFKYQWDQINRD
jgi:hypothetical protein